MRIADGKQLVLSLLVPGGLPDPAKSEPCVCADLDGGGFCFSDRLLHGLHEVLRIVHEHLSGLKDKHNQLSSNQTQ